jgi:ketosteroid isomerase-like protein
MSQENVEIVRRFNDAYNRRDREAVEALFHPEIQWHTIAGPLFGVEAMHGREESLRFVFEQIPEGIEDFRVALEEVSELRCGQVLAVAHYEGRGVTSGAAVEMSATQIYRFDTGLIVFFQDFATRDEALEAAGLSE